MPRTVLTADVIDPVAGKPAPTQITPDQPNGNAFLPDTRTFLRVANTNAATRTVTVHAPGKPGGFTVTDLTFVIPVTTGVTYIGPFPSSFFAQTADGMVWIDISASAGVVYELVRLPS